MSSLWQQVHVKIERLHCGWISTVGYDRELRNWPKYSMQGDGDAGEHDLVIKDVSREDAGGFECQVSPTANQPPLRRSTNLTVLGKSTVKSIVSLLEYNEAK